MSPYHAVPSNDAPMPNSQQFDPSPGRYLTTFERKQLLKSLQTELTIECRTRIEIMLLADEGSTQKQICTALGCSQATARYWINMAKVGNALQWGQNQRGRPKTVGESYLNQLKKLVSHSPRDYGYPFQYWTARWLKKHLAKETGIEISDRHINRLLREMGLSTRPKPPDNQEPKIEMSQEESSRIQISIRDLEDVDLS
jgi:transposase